jgi:hypothetical protein
MLKNHWLGLLWFPLSCVQWWLFSLPAIKAVELLVLPELNPVEVVRFLFVLLLCVGANGRFYDSGPWRTAGVGGFRRRCY